MTNLAITNLTSTCLFVLSWLGLKDELEEIQYDLSIIEC